MSNQVFISYRRSDSQGACDLITSSLRAALGEHEVFRDVTTIAPGADFRLAIEEGLNHARVALILIGPTWLTVTDAAGQRRLDDPQDRVRQEVEQALRRNIVVIPVLVQNAAPLRESELPLGMGPLAYRNARAVRPYPDHPRDIEALIEEIRDYLPVPIRSHPVRKLTGALRTTLGFTMSLITVVLTVMALATWITIPYLSDFVQRLIGR
jgi:hypothetical protein